MPAQNIHVLQETVTLEQLCEEVAKLQKIIRYLINGNLDFENVRVKGLTAETIDVNELSAISANMGKLTSGEIYGAYIATAEGAFPRAEMSSTDDLLALLTSLTNYIKVMAFDSFAGAPQLEFSNASKRLLMYVTASFINMQAAGDLSITSSGGTYLNDWSQIINSVTSQTLQTALNNKANGSGLSRTVYVALTSGGPATSPMTISNGIVTS